MKLLSEPQKIEFKGNQKGSNRKVNSNCGKLGQENRMFDGSVERWAIPGMDHALAERQPNSLSGKNCGGFDRHCNMVKYEDGCSSDLSDTQSLRSPSESSSGSRRRSKKSFDSTERGSPVWKNWAEKSKKQVRPTPTRPFRLLTEVSVLPLSSHYNTIWRKNWAEKSKKQVRPTPTRPFRLLTEQRGQMKEQQFMKKIQDEMTKEEKHRIPIAQRLPWTTDEPQVLPKPPVKEKTKPLKVKLRTETRSAERAKFDHLIEEKIYYLMQQRLEEERLWKQAEEEEIKRLRKEMIPYAQLMPFFDRPFVPKKSSKSPTIPKQPKFHSYQAHIKCVS